MRFPVVLVEEEESFVATCPIIPGCSSRGSTKELALEMLREAIFLCLEVKEAEGWSLPSTCDIGFVELLGRRSVN